MSSVFLECTFSDITTGSGSSCSIYVNSKAIVVELYWTRFIKLAFTKDTSSCCGNFVEKCLRVVGNHNCYINCRNPYRTTYFVLQASYGSTSMVEFNHSVAIVGDDQLKAGPNPRTLFNSGADSFHVFHHNNITGHKNFKMRNFLTFEGCTKGTESVSFCQFGTILAKYMLYPQSDPLSHAYSYFNILNATITQGFFLNLHQVGIDFENCIFSDVELQPSKGAAYVNFISCRFSFPEDHLPSLCNAINCLFNVVNPELFRIETGFNKKCTPRTNRFTNQKLSNAFIPILHLLIH